jgi:hypothetical protein
MQELASRSRKHKQSQSMQMSMCCDQIQLNDLAYHWYCVCCICTSDMKTNGSRKQVAELYETTVSSDPCIIPRLITISIPCRQQIMQSVRLTFVCEGSNNADELDYHDDIAKTTSTTVPIHVSTLSRRQLL